jgi:hypothetical protein
MLPHGLAFVGDINIRSFFLFQRGEQSIKFVIFSLYVLMFLHLWHHKKDHTILQHIFIIF